MKHFILGIGIMFAVCGCSSMFTVDSDPAQADVFFQPPNSTEKKILGKTPLKMPMSELKQTIGDGVAPGNYFTIGVEKAGYKTEVLQVPATRFGTTLTSLDVKMKQGEIVKEQRVARDILNSMFLAQRYALSQQYERAQIELDKVLANAPEFPRALSMRASIYFAQKNFVESLKWYDLALKADPQMEDVVRMIAKVRSLQGGERSPSATSKSGGP